LLLAPQLLAWLRRAGNGLGDQLGVRLAGGVPVLAAVFGLWSDTMHRIASRSGGAGWPEARNQGLLRARPFKAPRRPISETAASSGRFTAVS
jgi:hypothetical protein